MTQVVKIKCDGPDCSNSIEAHTDDGLLTRLKGRATTWFTVTEHGYYTNTYHFCSATCLRNSAQEWLKNWGLAGGTDER